MSGKRNDARILFAVAFFFGALAYIVQDPSMVQFFEVISLAAGGACIWEIWRGVRDHSSGGGIKLRPIKFN